MGTPTSLTVNYLRRHGIKCGSVERWIPQAKKRIDLLGFIDIVAVDTTRGKIIGIQATSFPNLSARVEKIIDLRKEEALDWLACGGEIQVWTWVKRKRLRENAKGVVKSLVTQVGRITFVDREVIRTGEYDWEELGGDRNG